MDSKGQVILRVGEHEYNTTRNTLQKRDVDSLFSELAQTATSPIFIDRDGTHFRFILNYLRDGAKCVLPSDPTVLEEVRVEAEFFRLAGLLSMVLQRTSTLLASSSASASSSSSSSEKSSSPSQSSSTTTYALAQVPALEPSNEFSTKSIDSSASSLPLSPTTAIRTTSTTSTTITTTTTTESVLSSHPTPIQRPRSTRFCINPKLRNLPLYSWEEIRQHNTEESCFLVANGYVYDVTEFLDIHPAGSKTILRRAGQDATVDFDFHSKSAQGYWEPLLIGELENAHKKNCSIM